jgi:signal transduction histidine kinase
MTEGTDGAGSVEAILRQVPLFAGLSDGQIDQLSASSRRIRAKPGDLLIREGEEGDALLIILSGELEITKHDGGREIALAIRKTGEILGEMSLLEQWPRTASVRAVSDSELLEVDAVAFRKLLETSPAIATTILRTMAGRLRSTEASLMQREKLASLGTLAAGLAHELNNPAAAIQRSISYLRDSLAAGAQREARLSSLDLNETELASLSSLRQTLRQATPATSVNPGRNEDAVIARLEAIGVTDPWEIGPALASAGWTIEAIETLAEAFVPAHRTDVLSWLGTRLASDQLIDEIQRSGRAISDIVRAVKSYAYLDQAAIQEVDLAASLDDTLMILKHKLGDIRVTRDYQPGLPRIEVYAGELNQVWTNLVDNAIDAMAGAGAIEIHARPLGDGVEVSVVDSGPGIPTEVSARIFDPFFTTKPQGVGTGLGLHIAHNIVVDRHHGRIDVDSRPGRTEFRVCLPRRLQRPAASATTPDGGAS